MRVRSTFASKLSDGGNRRNDEKAYEWKTLSKRTNRDPLFARVAPLLPLDRGGWLRRYVVDDAVDAADFIDGVDGNAGEEFVRKRTGDARRAIIGVASSLGR